MSEAKLQAEVNKLLTANGWRWTHFRTAITQAGHYVTAISGDKGFPDVIAVRGSRLLFAELKREGGKLEPAQIEWREALYGWALVESRREYHLWKPSDFLSGEIERCLE